MSAIDARARKTATSPTIHGRGQGLISTEDDVLIIEALRIAGDYIEREAQACAHIMPESCMVRRLEVFAENMRDLRERMEA